MHFARIIVNLLDCAASYSLTGTTIRVRAKTNSAGEIEIAVPTRDPESRLRSKNESSSVFIARSMPAQSRGGSRSRHLPGAGTPGERKHLCPAAAASFVGAPAEFVARYSL